MFFLGSFNSAIPYIIYLSVIWAFMLIGMTGGLSFFRNTEQVNPDHHIVFYQPDSANAHHYSDNRNIAFNWMAISPDSDPLRFIPPDDLHHLPGTEGKLITETNIAIFLRGPPNSFC